MDKKTFILVFVLIMNTLYINANQEVKNDSLKYLYETIENQQVKLQNSIRSICKNNIQMRKRLDNLEHDNMLLQHLLDSLHLEWQQLTIIQNNDRTMFHKQLDETNASLQSNQYSLTTRSYIAIFSGIFFLLLIASISYYLLVRIRTSNNSIDEIYKIQKSLQIAQVRMQEESIKLDNKLLEIVEKQIKVIPQQKNIAAVDHSLALKVADEIVRIELNLSRMDSSIKGYKQLAKAVQRIKDNFQANGYEIIDILDKPYNEGMRINANFIMDESLPNGIQRITSITKPQVNYNGEIIQKAQVTVSQNI